MLRVYSPRLCRVPYPALVRMLAMDAPASSSASPPASPSPADPETPVKKTRKPRAKKPVDPTKRASDSAIIRKIGYKDPDAKINLSPHDPYHARRHPSYLDADVSPYSPRASPSSFPLPPSSPSPASSPHASFIEAHPSYMQPSLRPEDAPLVRAAGLLLLSRAASGWRLLLIREARTNKRAFCELNLLGGKVDAEDGGDPLRTALREFDEESCQLLAKEHIDSIDGAFRAETAPRGGVLWWPSGKYALYAMAVDGAEQEVLKAAVEELPSRRAAQREAVGIVNVETRGDEQAMLHWVPLESLVPTAPSSIEVFDEQLKTQTSAQLSMVAKGTLSNSRTNVVYIKLLLNTCVSDMQAFFAGLLADDVDDAMQALKI